MAEYVMQQRCSPLNSEEVERTVRKEGARGKMQPPKAQPYDHLPQLGRPPKCPSSSMMPSSSKSINGLRALRVHSPP